MTASGLCAYAVDHESDSVTVRGSEGAVSMPFFAPGPVTLTRGDQVETINLPDPAHVHQPLIERVIAHLLDEAPNPCDGPSARVAVETVAEIYRDRTA